VKYVWSALMVCLAFYYFVLACLVVFIGYTPQPETVSFAALMGLSFAFRSQAS
jgi:hypothetical protein